MDTVTVPAALVLNLHIPVRLAEQSHWVMPWMSVYLASEKIVVKLRVSRGHVSARESRRVFVDLYAENVYLANYVNEVLWPCEVCRALDTAPHVPIAGTLAILMFSKKSQTDLLFLGDTIAIARWTSSPRVPS